MMNLASWKSMDIKNFSISISLLLVMQISAIAVGIQGVLLAFGHPSFNAFSLCAGVFGMASCTYLKVSESGKVYKRWFCDILRTVSIRSLLWKKKKHMAALELGPEEKQRKTVISLSTPYFLTLIRSIFSESLVKATPALVPEDWLSVTSWSR